ncbi:MAG: Formimidoylglutamase [Chlamydiae bacterium]|nr:Formimidoylglutamase [Chlamydiota bacterium]
MLYDDQEWVNRYRPASKTPWFGRKDGAGSKRFHEIFVCDDLRQPLETIPYAMNFGLVGFACDEGVRRNHGRPGAVEGPTAFREMLAKLPVMAPDNWKFYDVGDITCDDGDLETSQRCLGKTVHNLLEQGIFPLVIGGGHEVSWGNYQGVRASLPKSHLSIINFDSHFDIRSYEEQASSGTSFLQIHDDCHEKGIPFSYSCLGIQNYGNTSDLFEKAKQIGVQYVSADEIHKGSHHLDSSVNQAVEYGEGIYLTICLDVFASPFAPGVSAPQSLGLFPYHVIPAITHIARSGKVVCFDIAELNPKYDRDHTTVQLAALLTSTFIHEVVSEHYVRGPLTCCKDYLECES